MPGRASEAPLASLRAPKRRLRMTGSAGGRGLPARTHRADPGTAFPLACLRRARRGRQVGQAAVRRAPGGGDSDGRTALRCSRAPSLCHPERSELAAAAILSRRRRTLWASGVEGPRAVLRASQPAPLRQAGRIGCRAASTAREGSRNRGAQAETPRTAPVFTSPLPLGERTASWCAHFPTLLPNSQATHKESEARPAPRGRGPPMTEEAASRGALNCLAR